MKRTCRYIFNTLTVVSLLLLLATVGLWVDSYIAQDSVGYSGSDLTAAWVSESGQCGFLSWIHNVSIQSGGWTTYREPVSDDLSSRAPHWLGFGWWWGRNALVVVAPHWFLTLIFAILPAIWLFKWNNRRKLGPNACPGCGYELTGNETGVCPECGTKASSTIDP